MKPTRTRCVEERAVERAFPERIAHVDDCERCASLYAELADLRAIGKQLPVAQGDAEAVEGMRTALLAGAETPAAATSWKKWAGAGAIALAAGIALTFWLGRGNATSEDPIAVEPPPPTPAPVVEKVASVSAPAIAHEVTDRVETVRMASGRVKVPAAQRVVRVVSGDGEVEGDGAQVDVEIVDDQLREVVVHSGAVTVRLRGKEPVLVAAGKKWTPESAAVKVVTLLDQPDPPSPVRPTLPAHPERSRREAPAESKGPAETETETEAEAETETAPAKAGIEVAFEEAWAAMRQGDFGAAAKGFAVATAADPSHALAEDARYWRGIALARGGRKAQARVAMAEFLAMHPRAARAGEVSVMLGWMLVESGEREAAATRFQAGLNDASADVRSSARKGLDATRP